MKTFLVILLMALAMPAFGADTARVWNCSDRKDGTTICNVDCIGEGGKVLLTERMTIAKGEDSQKEANKVLAAFVARPAPVVLVPQSQSENETSYTKAQVSQILVDKGYLTKGQTLDDLTSKALAPVGEIK
jgi:hypothetical protein